MARRPEHGVVIVVGGLSVMSGRLGWPELLAFLLAMRARRTSEQSRQRLHGCPTLRRQRLPHRTVAQGKPEIQDRKDARSLSGVPS